MDTRPLTRVASQMLNQPLLVTEEHAALIVAAIRQRLNVELLVENDGTVLTALDMDLVAAEGRRTAKRKRATRRGGRIMEVEEDDDGEPQKLFGQVGKLAYIPINGTLTKTWGLNPSSGFTGYDGIKAKLFAAFEDDSVEAIVQHIDSPGGAVAGNFDLADIVWHGNEKNGGKPIYTIADEQMCSAALSIGTGGDQVWTTRTGQIGSVGVLMVHAEYSRLYEKEGVKAQILRAGERKARVNSIEPLQDEDREKLLVELEEMREMFVDIVARNMNVSKKSVRETEGSTYIGEHARERGFVNRIGSFEQAWFEIEKRHR